MKVIPKTLLLTAICTDRDDTIEKGFHLKVLLGKEELVSKMLAVM